MASTNEVENVTDCLAKTSVKHVNVVCLADSGRKLDTVEDVAEIVKKIEESQDVQALSLEGNTLGVEAAKAIAQALSKRKEFEKALWNDMFTGRLKAEIPKALESLGDAVITAGAQLSELDLCDNAFGPDGVKSVSKLLKSPSCFSLKTLKFNNNGLGIGGGKILSEALLECHKASVAAGTPLKLQVFVAGRNRLENEGSIALARAFTEIGTLEEISMPQNGINHPGISALAKSFEHNIALKVVNLNDNTFTAKGAIAMSKVLPSLTNLEVINFGDCLVKSKGASAIADAIKTNHAKLKELILTFCEINKDAALQVVESLENKKELKKLYLNGNSIGEDGKKEVQNRLIELKLDNVLDSMSDDEGEDSEPDDDESDEEDEDGGDEEKEKVNDEKIKSEQDDVKSAEKFLLHPSLESFTNLPHENRVELIKRSLKACINDAMSICKLFVEVSSMIHNTREFLPCTDLILREAFSVCDKPETVINDLLVFMGLLKSEEKIKPTCQDITGVLLALDNATKQEYFPKDCAFILTAFLSKQNTTVTCLPSAKSSFLETLKQL